MAMRITDAPYGGARYAYALLATIAAGLLGGIFLAIGWPIGQGVGACSVDQTGGLCSLALGLVMWGIGYWIALAALAYVFWLGVWFWLVDLVISVLAVQLTIQTDQLWWLIALPLAPFAAVALTGERPDRQTPRWRGYVISGIAVVVVVQLVVWLWLVLR